MVPVSILFKINVGTKLGKLVSVVIVVLPILIGSRNRQVFQKRPFRGIVPVAGYRAIARAFRVRLGCNSRVGGALT